MVLFIQEEDVRKALTIEDTIEAVEDAYRQQGRGLGQDTPRREVRIKGKGLPHIAFGTTAVHQGLAYLEESKVVVLSHLFEVRSRTQKRVAKGAIYLLDPSDGETLAVIQSPYGGWSSTGASGAVGAKYLSREDSITAGVIGTGRQGRSQLLFLSKVRGIEKAFAYSGKRRDEEYAREMGRKLGIDIVATDGPEEVVRNADVLITATFSTEPIVRGEWVSEGTHINAIGADCPLKAELDVATFERADKIVIDGDKAMTIGEIAIPMKQGILRPEDIYGKIGEVVAGVKPGREYDAEITIFESDGTGISGAGVAAKIYQKVKEMGLGIETSSQYFST